MSADSLVHVVAATFHCFVRTRMVASVRVRERTAMAGWLHGVCVGEC